MQQPSDDQHAPGLAPAGQYSFYPEDDGYGNLVYQPPGMGQYAPPPPHQMAPPDMQAPYQLGRAGLSLMAPGPQAFDQQMYTHRPGQGTPADPSPPPASPSLYDPLSPPISGSDTSGEISYHSHHSRNSSTSSSRANSLVHRNPLRYAPTPSPSGSSGRRSRGRSFNDSDEDMGVSIAETIATSRKEATRRQRIEAEQRRRDELRDGYARLKEVLPVSNQKSSKVSLLERATNHIVQLEKQNQQMQQRLQKLEAEVAHLRSLNEKMALTGSPSPGMSIGLDSRPLSPPPEAPKAASAHALANVPGEVPSTMSSPSSGDDF